MYLPLSPSPYLILLSAANISYQFLFILPDIRFTVVIKELVSLIRRKEEKETGVIFCCSTFH